VKPTGIALMVAAVLSMSSCRESGSTVEQPIEIARVRSDDLDLVVLSPDGPLSQGKDSVTLEFRRTSDGGLVDVGSVKGSATMPMAGMAPMFGSVDVQRADTSGRYSATTDLSMAGEWRLAIEWNGPAGSGSATFSTSAQ